MPTTRIRRRRDHWPPVTPTQWALLNDEPLPDEPGISGDFDRWCFNWSANDDPPWGRATGRALWSEHGEVVLRQWVAERPGSRPSCWWRFDAPVPRVRCGGIGTPCHERLAHVLRLHLGVPVDWITPALAADFARIGKPLGVPPIDPANPPRYESAACYLDRHDLLQSGERGRLRDHDFAPQSIFAIIGLDLGD